VPTPQELGIDAALRERGYSFASRGWPDRLCWRRTENGELEIACVEVKANGSEPDDGQLLVHAILAAAGVPTYIVRQETDLDGLRAGASPLPGWCRSATERLQDYVDDLSRRLSRLAEAHLDRKQRILARAHREAEDYARALDERFRQLESIVEGRIQRIEELKGLFAPPAAAEGQGTGK
jgi:predicted transcriptional regulator